MPSSNQGLWPHTRANPLDPRPAGDHYLSYTDPEIDIPVVGWPIRPPSAIHANKLFDAAFQDLASTSYGYNNDWPDTATGAWEPRAWSITDPSFAESSNIPFGWYKSMFDANVSNPAFGARGYDPNYVWSAGSTPFSALDDKSLPEYAYNEALKQHWVDTGIIDDPYQAALLEAKEQAARDLRFNLLRRGLSGSGADEYVRQEVARRYAATKDNPLSSAEMSTRIQAAIDPLYQEYQSTYSQNVPGITGGSISGFTDPDWAAWHSRPTEPTTALANQHYESTPDIDYSDLNLGDVFAELVGKFPPSYLRRKIAGPSTLPEELQQVEISTVHNLPKTPNTAGAYGGFIQE